MEYFAQEQKDVWIKRKQEMGRVLDMVSEWHVKEPR
jgi:hypothetical protein